MSAAESEDPLPVLIIGAGACGLAIAQGLKRRNVPYRVFEQQSCLEVQGARDWAVACHWSAPTLKWLMGETKWARIYEALVDPSLPVKEQDLINVINGATGKTINHLPFANFHRLNRSRLRRLLAEDLQVSFGKKLVNITYHHRPGPGDDGCGSVAAHFADGTQVKGRLLIGADGSRSRARSLLLGDPAAAALKRLPFAATFVNASFTREQALLLRRPPLLHPLFNIVVHPAGTMGMVAALDAPVGSRPEEWRFTFYISWGCSVSEQEAEAEGGSWLRRVKERSRGYADPVRCAFEWVPDDLDTVYFGGVANWDPSLPGHEWDSRGGLVTLAGDAAHPMTYHRGQGFNHAIEDAGQLVKLLLQADRQKQQQAELIQQYETEMRARSGAEVQLSEANTVMLHDWTKLQESPLLKRSLARANVPGPAQQRT